MSSRFLSSYTEDVALPAKDFVYERPNTSYEWRRHKGIDLTADISGDHHSHPPPTSASASASAASPAPPTSGEPLPQPGHIAAGATSASDAPTAHTDHALDTTQDSLRVYDPNRAVSIYSSDFESALVAAAGEREETARRLAAGPDAVDPTHAPPPVLAKRNKVEQTRPPREHEVLCPLPVRSMCHREYGEYGYNPVEANPRHPKEISLRSSNADLAAGSTKTTNHLPGYTGFLPADPHNVHARRQAVANCPRRTEKASSTLNVGREMVPGYAGYRPSSPSFNANRSFRMYRQSEYADAFYRKPVTADDVVEQRKQRELFSRVLNPWNHASFNIS
ncbi:uncharacterized protein AMSG_03253 [Thecamonas trahens ATCC 50062]|uniref:Uncharacterized protein n=1 Tax=Thecamonas trahens ATCC 50062 TaxID=461836 RepID=A0A0L0D3A6_THETB|nr:hypothetical protein AMSG_03253 [Thecamonas trahens ATCC 50062]KNC46822.1 hypothetical protein AMSG_03253 [Thecamonas trahens ATCC 50062]|eukprot:XP_013760097.1 hypothetical protein AMSG_03253 [Thecamonas trahens ATCC 50062]